MGHLTAEQTEMLQAEIQASLEKLTRSMAITDEALKPVELDQTAVGRLSRIDSLQNQGITKNLREREVVKLAQLQQALKRMDEGDYGLCTECRSEIPFGRLVVFPEAPNCSSCPD